MKTCSKCRKSKDDSCFDWKVIGVRRQSQCQVCQKAYRADWYARHRDQQKARVAKVALELRYEISVIIQTAKDVPCCDCGRHYGYWVMDFDHRPGVKKLFDISVARKGNKRIAVLKAEIAKCDVVCANCHRDRTHARLQKS